MARNPLEIALEHHRGGRLRQAEAGYRAILVLHDVEGLSHEECAAILECRVGTCKSQLHKARARMRELLGDSLGDRLRGRRDGRDGGETHR